MQDADLAYRQAAAAQVSELRRQACMWSLAHFTRVYLSEQFVLPSSLMHDELMELMTQVVLAPRDRHVPVASAEAQLAAAVPSGYGKTVLASLALPLWTVCYGHARFVCLYAATRVRAGEHLANVARELRQNRLLLSDFPHLRDMARGGWSSIQQRRELNLGSHARIVALAAGADASQLRWGPHKPQLLIFDDVEREWESLSGRRVATLRKWIVATVGAPAYHGCAQVVVGSLWRPGTRLERLLDPLRSPGWTARRYAAVTRFASKRRYWEVWERVHRRLTTYRGGSGPVPAEAMLEEHRSIMGRGVSVLWPQRESFEQLMVRRLAMGWHVFDAQLQNRPDPPNEVTLPIGATNEEVLQAFTVWTDAFGMRRGAYRSRLEAAPGVAPAEAADGVYLHLNIPTPEPWPEDDPERDWRFPGCGRRRLKRIRRPPSPDKAP